MRSYKMNNALSTGLEINTKNTKSMKINVLKNDLRDIVSFTYLGSKVGKMDDLMKTSRSELEKSSMSSTSLNQYRTTLTFG